MSIKVVVAVGNKKIERFIAQMDTIDVLTTIRRKEAVLDAIINYNPHVVVLSRELSGKIEMTDVIRRCRSLKEKCRVVFIYGEIDTEYKYFSYFFVQQGIYNILTGAVDAERLEDVIERVYTLEDIVGYQLNQENGPKKSVLDPTPNTSPTLVEPAPEKELEVLFVEKIVERETIQTTVLGNVIIGVSSLFPHGGSTHTALELAAYLHRLKKDSGSLTDQQTYDRIKGFYMLKENNGLITLEGIPIYTDEAQIMNSHRTVIRDMGRLTDHNASCFLKANLKLLVCGVSAWEIDTLTDFLRGNKYANTIKYLLWPANEVQTKSYIKNLRHGECHGYTVSYNPDPLIKNADNTKMFQKLLQPLVNTI